MSDEDSCSILIQCSGKTDILTVRGLLVVLQATSEVPKELRTSFKFHITVFSSLSASGLIFQTF